MRETILRNSLQWQLARLSIFAAFGSLALASLIRSGLKLDPAVLPAGICIALLLLRRRRAWLLSAALLIMIPVLVFFDRAALLDPLAATRFANHLALLVAGMLAASAALFAAFDMEL